MRKNYFEICPICGAHLDPGEKCDCENNHPEAVIYNYDYEKDIKKECPSRPKLRHTEKATHSPSVRVL